MTDVSFATLANIAADALEQFGHNHYSVGADDGTMCARGALLYAMHTPAVNKADYETRLSIESAFFHEFAQFIGLEVSWPVNFRVVGKICSWNNRDERTAQEVIDAYRAFGEKKAIEESVT